MMTDAKSTTGAHCAVHVGGTLGASGYCERWPEDGKGPCVAFDPLASLGAYLRERNARLRACTGSDVTKYPGRYLWYCATCGEEFASESQAIAPKHDTEESQ